MGEALHELGPEAVALAVLAMGKRIAELEKMGQSTQPSPSTPSGMVPIYTKPNKPKRHKKPGARDGHPGTRRQKPTKIDEHETHRLEQCPCCGGALQRCDRKRTRVIEDIPEVIDPVATEHTIYRDYCPHCKKHVEPVVTDAMPKATLCFSGATMRPRAPRTTEKLVADRPKPINQPAPMLKLIISLDPAITKRPAI